MATLFGLVYILRHLEFGLLFPLQTLLGFSIYICLIGPPTYQPVSLYYIVYPLGISIAVEHTPKA